MARRLCLRPVAPLGVAALLLIAALALGCAPRPARGAFDCSAIPGCSACAYQFDEKARAAALVCTACSAPAYVLQASKNRCNCAPGHYSRFANGTAVGRCAPAPAGAVAAAGVINSAANALRLCLDHSAPADNSTRCLCAPGFYAAVGGQAPRCKACGAASYTDAPNARGACRACPVGRVANAARTGCEPLAVALAARKNATATTTTTTTASVSSNNATANATATSASTNVNATLGGRLSAAAARANQTLANATAAVEDALQKAAARANATVYTLLHRPNVAPWVQAASNATQRVNAKLAAAQARAANTTAAAIISRLNVTQLADTPFVARALNATSAALLESAWKALQAKGLPLPSVASLFKSVPAAPAVPGLSTGSKNGVEALGRVAKAVWTNPDYRDIAVSAATIIVKAVYNYAG